MKAIILVVEDHPSMLGNIAFTLEMAGYGVLKASNGKEALELLRSHTPDLILSDIMMPEMDGYELLDRVHETPKWRAIPFIFLTARSDREDISLGRRMGSDDYLVKPLDPDDLLSAVEGKLERMNQLRAAYVGEKEELEAQLVETERMATVGTLATSAIHEIRNPLTAVHGLAELLQLDLPPDSPAHENLDVIIEQVGQINRIAERVMELAHPNPEDF